MSKAAVGVVGFDEALKLVLAHAADLTVLATEQTSLVDCEDRAVAKEVLADRDEPPFDRSTRDGFAVRAADFGSGPLKIAGQIRAGEQWEGSALEPGAAIGIMTGAPIPEGADAVVMVEHVEPADGVIRPLGGRTIRSGRNIVRRGSEDRGGEVLLPPFMLITIREIAQAEPV